MSATEVLAELRQAGVKLAAVGSKLRFRPLEKVTAEWRARLVQHKAELLALLAEEQREAQVEREAIQWANEQPRTEAIPWDERQARQIVDQMLADVAAEHSPGTFDLTTVHWFDDALLGAFEANNLSAVREACRDYRLAVRRARGEALVAKGSPKARRKEWRRGQIAQEVQS
jgi:hypothetical protein